MNPERILQAAAVYLFICVAAPVSAQSVVFVSDGVPEAGVLVREALPGQEVVLLRSDDDAIEQISRALVGRAHVASLAIVSHGSPGALQLGSARLDTRELTRRAAEVRAWRGALAPGADILLYGCEIGAGDAGSDFVDTLASLTGADVAASTDTTGGASEDDWALERRVGRVTAGAPWPADVLDAWRHQLIVVTEPPDFSNSIAGAPVEVLTIGTNTISGTLLTPTDGQDNFQVQIPAGLRLNSISLTVTGGSFNGSVTFNLNETLTGSGNFTQGFPYGPGTYFVQVVANFSTGTSWSMTFTVGSAVPVCGNGVTEAGEACDDGNATQCDGCSNACAVVLNGCNIGGVCIAEGTINPANQCTACQRAVSRTLYTSRAAGSACDDGQFCTVSDACNGAGACTSVARSCADALTCTTDSCDETMDLCTHPVTSGCLIGGACIADGTLNPANACTRCSAASSTSAYTSTPAGSACDDGMFCTVGDACNGGGTCATSARNCMDALACTTDSCNEAMDLCLHPLATGCLIGAACIAAGTHDPSNACMQCNPATSTTTYTPSPAGGACDDGMFCTTGDACNGTGTCGGAARSCADALTCTTDTCNEGTDACDHPVTTGCLIGGACIADGAHDPANACTQCVPATTRTTYSPSPSGTSCDDAQFCTTADACNGSGTCTGSARNCSDTLSCTTDSCDEAADVCSHPLSTGCLIAGACVASGAADPANACTVCTPGTSTSAYSPATSGTTCDDTLFCTTTDVCDGAGACAGAARDCSDTSSCTTDACDETADACTNVPMPGCGDAGTDAGIDGGAVVDAAITVDGGTTHDAATIGDTGVRTDARVTADGSTADGSNADAGGAVVSNGGCGCRVGHGPRFTTLALLAFVMALVMRRRAARA